MPKSRILSILAILLLASTLAGCIGGESEEMELPPNPILPEGPADANYKLAQANELERFFEAIDIVPENDPEFTRPNVTKRDWLLLTTPLTPEGSVTGFKFTYPKEALALNQDTGLLDLVLDIAIADGPMGSPAGLPVDVDWLILVASENLDTSTSKWETVVSSSQVHFGVTVTEERQESLGAPQSDKIAAPSKPFGVTIPYDPLTVGDTVHIIVAARGASGTFGVGVRMTDLLQLSRDWDDFYSLTFNRKPFVPERSGTGEGLHLVLYEQQRDSAGLRTRYSADAGKPAESLPPEVFPVLSARDMALRSETSWGGWSTLDLSYESSIETGTLAITGNVHDEELDRTFYFLGHAGLIPDEVIPDGFFPPPVVRISTEGSTGSSIDLRHTKSGSVGSETLRFRHVSLGAQLEELTGLPYRGLVLIS